MFEFTKITLHIKNLFTLTIMIPLFLKQIKLKAFYVTIENYHFSFLKSNKLFKKHIII